MACCQRVLTGSASIRAQVSSKFSTCMDQNKKLIAAEDGVLGDTGALEQRQHLRPYFFMSLVVRLFRARTQPQKERDSLHNYVAADYFG